MSWDWTQKTCKDGAPILVLIDASQTARVRLRSAEVLVLSPKLGPGQAWWAADEDVGMILAFFVAYAFGVAVVAGPATVGEDAVGLLARDSERDDRGGRWGGRDRKGVV